ncbi:Muskelin 1, intracellular mediator containing kelch motif, partial [Coemansia sp. RSA 2703]
MTASNGIQPNVIAQAGMSETDCGHRHAGLSDSERQQPLVSADTSAQRPSPTTTAAHAYNLSAPFMTNANYRIIPPTPDASSSTSATSLGAERARIALQSLVSDLPAWIASSARSKTYFPATSPIVDGGGAFTGENPSCHEGALDIQKSDSAGMSMQVDGVQELRTEYEVLPYEIHNWSSHSANFLPNNIIVDRPHDQASRWSTVVNNHRQYITLRLERPALV